MVMRMTLRQSWWQIHDLTAMVEMDSTPRFELGHHRPLGKITPFRGKLDESDNSIQWLRGFVYEMKGTHTPPNQWYMAFQLSLRDGASFISEAETYVVFAKRQDHHCCYYGSQLSQSASTCYYRAKQSEK
ncbi:Eukaryotic/viral aspartic protease [Phytophthora megakarya]|uniref:Eukaryotic/viral aspartic protease n=1 Tax=Phytophthora megakarya TaxID=4795 RepID=A0A225VN95_9STRA|nr:Eukaryotic/viral aspartic protease [Phytophthora megakarya]